MNLISQSVAGRLVLYKTPCSVGSATSSGDIPSSPVRIAALSSP